MRENYRQFFLRVTEENVDEVTSTNLRMPIGAKVLDVVVENVRHFAFQRV